MCPDNSLDTILIHNQQDKGHTVCPLLTRYTAASSFCATSETSDRPVNASSCLFLVFTDCHASASVSAEQHAIRGLGRAGSSAP